MTTNEKALLMHEKWNGKLETVSKTPVKTREDLAIAYTPGVAEPCKVIAKDKEAAYKYTMKANTVAVVSDGSAVLGLGNIGPYAALPVDRVYLECGDSGNVTKLLPLASHVILSCTCGADLIPEADRLYKLGYRRFSLLPTDAYDRAAFVADAEKLTREWIRIERNDPDARFVPFTFAEVQPGFCGDTVPTDTLPGYFQNAGLLSHITPVTQDPVVLAKCAECAIVLQAQRK